MQQVAADARALRRVWGLRVAAVFGGADRVQQIELLAKKPHVLVATPGRLLDLIDDGALSLGERSPACSLIRVYAFCSARGWAPCARDLIRVLACAEAPC